METTAEGVVASLSREQTGVALSLRQMIWRRFRHHRMAMAGAVMLILLILYCFGGALFISEDYANLTDTKQRLQAPSREHPFGTDTVGRDILARTIYGGQISMLIGLSAAAIEVVAGVLVGALAGYYGGVIDSLLMRFTEAMFTIPQLFLLLVMAKFFANKFPAINILGRTLSGSVVVIVLIIGVTSWMYLARIVRADFLSLKEREFVTAAHTVGTRSLSIIFRHILPNTAAPIIVAATLGVANAILSEAYISFLGLGVQPPTATWGNMLDRAYNYVSTAPWMWVFPGLLIVLVVLSINFLGDGLRDALDPTTVTKS
ncbi:MAG: ABC transporter permease [Anaerolineae bacterium]|jgi:peptide/nickel transport system permease protein|nr:ABC transporter permease [Anaerolineae bacterium]MDX9830553.1 ABC transporter permease [Anaerolineae bacterium]